MPPLKLYVSSTLPFNSQPWFFGFKAIYTWPVVNISWAKLFSNQCSDSSLLTHCDIRFQRFLIIFLHPQSCRALFVGFLLLQNLDFMFYLLLYISVELVLLFFIQALLGSWLVYFRFARRMSTFSDNCLTNSCFCQQQNFL